MGPSIILGMAQLYTFGGTQQRRRNSIHSYNSFDSMQRTSRSFPFFSSCLMGVKSSSVAISYFFLKKREKRARVQGVVCVCVLEFDSIDSIRLCTKGRSERASVCVCIVYVLLGHFSSSSSWFFLSFSFYLVNLGISHTKFMYSVGLPSLLSMCTKLMSCQSEMVLPPWTPLCLAWIR